MENPLTRIALCHFVISAHKIETGTGFSNTTHSHIRNRGQIDGSRALGEKRFDDRVEYGPMCVIGVFEFLSAYADKVLSRVR